MAQVPFASNFNHPISTNAWAPQTPPMTFPPASRESRQITPLPTVDIWCAASRMRRKGHFVRVPWTGPLSYLVIEDVMFAITSGLSPFFGVAHYPSTPRKVIIPCCIFQA